MKNALLIGVLMGLGILVVGDVATRPAATQPAIGKGGELAALEKKLVREWQGPACGGNFTFKADGKFVCDSYTPAGCTLSGKWVVRWDALPPTLALTFERSDWSKKFPGEEFKYLGKTLEVRILELDDGVLVFKEPKGEWDWRGRVREKE
jgi:hypothetical protein